MKLFKLLLLCCLAAYYVGAVFEFAVAGVGIASLVNSRKLREQAWISQPDVLQASFGQHDHTPHTHVGDDETTVTTGLEARANSPQAEPKQ